MTTSDLPSEHLPGGPEAKTHQVIKVQTQFEMVLLNLAPELLRHDHGADAGHPPRRAKLLPRSQVWEGGLVLLSRLVYDFLTAKYSFLCFGSFLTLSGAEFTQPNTSLILDLI